MPAKRVMMMRKPSLPWRTHDTMVCDEAKKKSNIVLPGFVMNPKKKHNCAEKTHATVDPPSFFDTVFGPKMSASQHLHSWEDY